MAATTPLIQELAALDGMSTAELVDRYEELHGRPPRSKNRENLRRRVAWKIQEQRLGGLSETAKRRLDELIAEIDLPIGGRQTSSIPVDRRKAGEPLLGTTLVRMWHGREIRTTSVEGGWEFEGAVYRSLSAVARAVTGARWNGRLFWGLTKRGSGK